MKRMVFASIVLLSAVFVGSAAAHTADDPCVTDLLAGQHIDAGDVKVWNDDANLYVQYVAEGGWELVETHLHVATSLDDIPQKNGNPIPGQFDYSMDHDPPVTEYTYAIPLTWDPCTELCIAAHAVVEKVTILTLAPYGAAAIVDVNQGLKKNGTPVNPGRSDPNQALEWEQVQDESSFFSLGFGGYIVVEFNCPIWNGDGNDIQVVEDTWGTYPLETAEVLVSQDGTTWTSLGTATNLDHLGIWTISEFDLNDVGLDWVSYVKVVDTTDPGVHNNNADGYDLNAVLALHDCVMVEEETAWGDGFDFPGRNWATYLKYRVQQPCDAATECADFSVLNTGDPGDPVEGLGTVHPQLDIQDNIVGNSQFVVKQGVNPLNAYNSIGGYNGCIGDAGFGNYVQDYVDHDLTFEFAPGVTVSSFSIKMYDYGDWFPVGTQQNMTHTVELVAYSGVVEVDSDTLTFTTTGGGSTGRTMTSLNGVPTDIGLGESGLGHNVGDSCGALDYQSTDPGPWPGRWEFQVQGSGIDKVELLFVDEDGSGPNQSLDPGLALNEVCFEIECQ